MVGKLYKKNNKMDVPIYVLKSPHKSRYDKQWSQELIDMVKNRIDEFPFLEGYSYED